MSHSYVFGICQKMFRKVNSFCEHIVSIFVLLKKKTAMNRLYYTLIIVLISSCSAISKTPGEDKEIKESSSSNLKSIYSFKVTDINGDEFDFATLRGKKIMVVNTASKCGLTPQYQQLEELHQEFKDSNFVIVGFPANNFMEQEPGSNEEIAEFCQKNYGVTFLMMGKVSVKGDDMHEIYKFLTQKELNGVESSEVKWNFQKFLLNEEGNLVKVVGPRTLPTDPEIKKWISEKK